MDNFDTVNKEIQDFLSTKQTYHKIEGNKEIKQETDIKYVLESLLHTYNEINTYLKSSNTQGVKDVILRNDIKLNMVNESLLKTLSQAVNDKNKLIDDNQTLNRNKLELEQELSKIKMYAKKLEGDVEYKTSSISELNRIMQDQKQKLSNEIAESQKAKGEMNICRVKIEELETLRKRAAERFSNYVKEMNILTKLASEREQKYNELLRQKREEENKNSGIKIKITEAERQIEVLERKLEAKAKNMNLCSEELAKLLTENKRFLAENDKFKNNAVYYEGLYKNLNEQNSYLNSQLSKIIQSDKYNKENVDLLETFNKKVRKIKSKAKKYKNRVKELTEENADLKEKVEEELYKVNPSDDTFVMQNKIEELSKLNKEFKEKIKKMEEQKKEAEELRKKNEEKKFYSGFVPKKVDYKFSHRPVAPINKISRPNFEYKKPKEFYRPITEFQSVPIKSPSFPLYKQHESSKNISPVYKPIELENDYKARDFYPGGFTDLPKPVDIDRSFYENAVKLEHEYNTERKAEGGKFTKTEREQISEKLARLGTIANKAKKVENLPVKSENIFDGPSTESVKSYHTSSTLKEMMARTEMLKKKFEHLENELGEIKEGKTDDRLIEQMKMYNNYYSDINVDNESDIL